MTRALDVANDLSTFQSKYNNGVLDNVTLTNSIIDTTTTTNGTFTLSGNLKIPENYGIDFNNYGSEDSNSATTVGSNLLDDYEEGTWTPNVFHVSSDDSTWEIKQGFYIKIGRHVNLWGRCDYGNSGTAGSALRINGFPFPAATTPTWAHTVGSFTYNGTASHADRWQLVNALHADSYGSGNHTTQVSYIGFFLTYYTD